MTPGNVIEVALARSGIHNPSTPQEDRARFYLNVAKTNLENLSVWRFMFKTATVTTTANTRGYALASDVIYPLHFWDYTNNKTVTVVHPEEITDLDPDEDNTGEGVIIAITGISASTGYWQIDIYPTPDTSSESVKYRYYKTIADFTSSDDDTEMLVWYPKFAQTILLWDTAALYKEEQNGDAAEEIKKRDDAIKAALLINGNISTAKRIVMGRGAKAFQISYEVEADA